MCEPQTEQNRRNFPGEDSNEASLSSPEIQRNRTRATAADVLNAAAYDLRQVMQ